MANPDVPYLVIPLMTLRNAAATASARTDFCFTEPIKREDFITERQYKYFVNAAKVVHSARYTIFKLSSGCPYKDEFYETLENIRNLQPKLE